MNSVSHVRARSAIDLALNKVVIYVIGDVEQ